MRTLPLLFALASTSAFAYDSTAEDVTFEAHATLFKGMDYSIKLPSEDSPVALEFQANTDGHLDMNMSADSELSWPDGLQQTWQGVVRGGDLQLDTTTTIGAYVAIDAFGYVLDIPLWERQWSWSGTSVFDSVLLPGGSNTATVGLQATELLGLDYDFDVTDSISVVLSGDLYPAAYATLHGESMTTAGQTVTSRGEPADIPAPSNNIGTLTLASEWEGTVEGKYGIELVPALQVCFDGNGCLTVARFTYLWELGNEAAKPMRSEVAEFTHDLPAIGTVGTVDLGEVDVGQVVDFDINVRNLGQIELVGDATYTGDAYFEIVEDTFYSTRTLPGVVTIEFAPEEAGTFTGTLTIASNDPIKPSITIPVRGTAVPAPPTDDGDGPGADGGLGAAACGCDSTTGTAPGSLMLIGLLGLALRRRKA